MQPRRAPSWNRSPARKVCASFGGGWCPPRRRASARSPWERCPGSSSCSWRRPLRPCRTRTGVTPSRSIGAPSCCASGPSTPSKASTSRHSRRARLSTRECSPPSSCASSSPICAIRRSRRGWRSSTRGSRRTPSRAGRWPTPTGTCATTARSTRWRATATGCGPVKPCWTPNSSTETCRASIPSARREPATRPVSTKCSSCCISVGVHCPMPS